MAVHSTYWNGGFLVSVSGGRLESSCLKIGRASTSLKETEERGEKNTEIEHRCDAGKTPEKTENHHERTVVAA